MILLLAAAWLAGLLLALALDLEPTPLLLLATATAPLGLALRLAGRNPLPAILLGTLLLGCWRGEAAGVPGLALDTGVERELTFRGRIADDPEHSRQFVRFTLVVEEVDRGNGWREERGKILFYAAPPRNMVAAREPPYFRHGDFLALGGTAGKPGKIDGFDYAAYLASQGISGVVFSRDVEWLPEESGGSWRTGIYRARGRLSDSLAAALPSPQSSLAQGMLLGRRGQISQEVRDSFRQTGTAHLLAISGLHVGVILAMGMGAAGAIFGRRRQFYLLLPLAAIWVYALTSGLPVSALRAGLMGSLYLAAIALGRPHNPMPALALSAVVITAFDPLALTQVSFQLSFTAMAGVLLALPWAERANDALRNRPTGGGPTWKTGAARLGGWAASGAIVSVGATVGTFPLVALYFGQVPLLGIPLTILALPSLPFILGTSLATALGGLAHPILGQVLGVAAWAPLSYLLAVVSAPPGPAVATGWAGPPLVWSWYLALAGVLLVPKGLLARLRLGSWWSSITSAMGSVRTPFNSRVLTLVLVAGTAALAGATLLLWAQVIWGPDGKLRVYFFDVGQGDSALIVTPKGRQVLIDGGPDTYSATRALPQGMLPWDRSLELVILTHPDADHARGLLETLDQYRVGLALAGVPDATAPMSAMWQDRLTGNRVELRRLASGDRVELEEGVTLEVLHPAEERIGGAARNNNGLVLRLVYGEVSFLFAADIEKEAEEHLADSGQTLESTVLKVPHHGSRTSSTALFLDRVDAEAAVISAGADNRFGHPHTEVAARLEEMAGPDNIYRTARHGNIEFVTDGVDLWVKTER